MSKELKELLKKINDKKNAIKSLVEENKITEAKAAKEELIELQDKFNILADLDDEEMKDAERRLEKNLGIVDQEGNKKKYAKKDIARAFVNRIVCGMRKTQMKDEDIKIMNEMSEGSDEDGGFTVPEDIRYDINELRRTSDDLETYCNVEPVSTDAGSRVYEEDADSTPWEDVEEGEEFGEEETPKLKTIKYAIKKKGGILKVTRELLQDTAVNILGYLSKWIAKKSRATRNAAILKKLDEITKGKEVTVETCDDLKDILNVTLDPAIAAAAKIYTNQYGFNYLDKLKDEEGRYILQPDVTNKTKMLLFGAYEIVKLSNKTLKRIEVKGDTSHQDKVTAYEYPLYIGDMSEAITLFDREKMSIELSTEAGDLWAKDKTGIKVRDRFDVQAFDTEAIVKGKITVAIAG